MHNSTVLPPAVQTPREEGLEAVRIRAEGATSKARRPLDKGDVYKLPNNRTYAGEAAHKG